MDYPELSKEWHSLSRYLALVCVEDEQSLIKLSERCKARGLLTSLIQEPDLKDQVTALAIEPSDMGRKIVSNFPLTLKDK